MALLSDHVPGTYVSSESATQEQKAQARVHTRQILQPSLPGFTDEQWDEMFDRYAPSTFWVDDEKGLVELPGDVLEAFANWVHLKYGDDQAVTLFGYEAYYLARNMVSYSKTASELVANDPGLSKPESIDVMRSWFYRLSAGNAIAERVHDVYQEAVEPRR